jgi:hypothetical protein
VLDAWGGIHAFGGAPLLVPSQYTPGAPFAGSLTLRGDDSGGVVLDRSGSAVSSFGRVGGTVSPCYAPAFSAPLRSQSFYVGVALDPTISSGGSYDKHGACIDGSGLVSKLNSSSAIAVTGPLWRGWDIARGLAVTEGGTGGIILDGWGGLHAYGRAHLGATSAYWPGRDIARGVAVDGHGGGIMVDAWGGLHDFAYTVD